MQLNFVSYGTTFATSCLISIQIYSKKKVRKHWKYAENQASVERETVHNWQGVFQPEIVNVSHSTDVARPMWIVFSFPNDLAYIVCCKCNYYGSLPCYKIKLFYSEVSYNQISPPLIICSCTSQRDLFHRHQ